MTTYNRAKYLPQAFDSVIAQSYLDWELLVVDDNSSDNTGMVVRRYSSNDARIKYFRNDTNLGIEKSRNLGLSKCGGEFVAVLDSDDAWTDRAKLQKQIEFLENNPAHVLCGCQARVIDEDGLEIGYITHALDDAGIRDAMLLSNQFVHSSAVFRKNAAVSAGGYGGYMIGEDYDLFLNIGLKGKFANMPDTMVDYRRHSAGVTWKNKVVSAGEHLKIIKKFKGRYPNYCLALVKAYFRIIFAYLRLI
jgi:glycosyltransferase involved in cell wall biosynthesis